MQTLRKEFSRHKGSMCKGPPRQKGLRGFSGEQGDSAVEVSCKGRKEAKQVRERKGQRDRQRQIVGGLVWSPQQMREDRAHTRMKKMGKEGTPIRLDTFLC